jgi:DNA integrity scanning protein DisA with diadenylate cyclase activity
MKDLLKRWELRENLDIFISSFKYIIPTYENKNKILHRKELLQIWNRNKEPETKRLKATWDLETEALVIFLYPGEGKLPISGFALKPSVKLSNEDIHFARAFSKVFNLDLSLCGNINKTDEIWRALGNTQFLRAISRFAYFKTLSVSKWIQAMENSMFLTYEGRSVEHVILLPFKFNYTLKKLKDSFVRLKKSLTIEEALLEEKWIRAVVDGRRVALLGAKSNNGSINGFISLPELKNNTNNGQSENIFSYAPHESLEDLQAVLEKNDMAFVATSSGDILILMGTGIVFHKTQGRWRYLNYNHFHQILVEFVDEVVTYSIVSAVLNLSFERRGTLFCIVKSRHNVKQLVPDHSRENQANNILRKALKGLNITNKAEKQIITAAAAIDGAVIMDQTGKILDVACMIGKANDEQLKKIGMTDARVFPGARTTAAWNASLFGVAIKVSQDGQITVFSEGKVIWEIG